jgi:hypothetical protein
VPTQKRRHAEDHVGLQAVQLEEMCYYRTPLRTSGGSDEIGVATRSQKKWVRKIKMRRIRITTTVIAVKPLRGATEHEARFILLPNMSVTEAINAVTALAAANGGKLSPEVSHVETIRLLTACG